MSRIALRTLSELVIAVALTFALGGLYFWIVQGVAPAEAFFVRSVGQVLGFVDIGIITWAVLLIVGAVRRRGIGWGIGGGVLAALVGALVNIAWIVILSAAGGGVDPLAIALGVLAGILFIASATVALLVVRRGIPAPHTA